jgi:hypothetical protein
MGEREIECMKFLLSILGVYFYHSFKSQKKSGGREMKGYESLIGNTPLIKLNTLSKLLGCDVLVKVSSIFDISSLKLYQ